MFQLKRILVPIDFSELSNHALDYAIELATPFGASIIALHAYELPIYGFPDGAMLATADVARRIETGAKQALDLLVSKRQAPNRDIQAVLRQGVVWQEINHVAEEMHADLIVIGTHGRRGLTRALLGSVTENVIRTAAIPVLTLHQETPISSR